jgi:hypothetical protein
MCTSPSAIGLNCDICPVYIHIYRFIYIHIDSFYLRRRLEQARCHYCSDHHSAHESGHLHKTDNAHIQEHRHIHHIDIIQNTTRTRSQKGPGLRATALKTLSIHFDRQSSDPFPYLSRDGWRGIGRTSESAAVGGSEKAVLSLDWGRDTDEAAWGRGGRTPVETRREARDKAGVLIPKG